MSNQASAPTSKINASTLQEMDLLVGFDVYSVVISPDEMEEIERQEEASERFGLHSTVDYPEGEYRKRYFNTTMFQIESFLESYDKKHDTPIIFLTLLNELTRKTETISVKSTIEDFLPYISLFGCGLVELKQSYEVQRVNLDELLEYEKEEEESEGEGEGEGEGEEDTQNNQDNQENQDTNDKTN